MTLSSVSDVDASSGKHLAGKYAIAGIGETAYLRGSNRTTRSMATEAISKAMADAGIKAQTHTLRDISALRSRTAPRRGTAQPHAGTTLGGCRLNARTGAPGCRQMKGQRLNYVLHNLCRVSRAIR